nr:hypothetical protein [Kibdelosporangium sp. MJ126-NF4]CTQ95133.1 hypothetical protein [Kibdelosporangium sp. MJ126-NF4]
MPFEGSGDLDTDGKMHVRAGAWAVSWGWSDTRVVVVT